MSKNDFSHSVFVTGANRGIGLGYVKFYLKKGTSVVATSRNPKESTELTSLQKEYPNQLIMVELDVGSQESIEQLTDLLKQVKATFQIAINNAGISLTEEFGSWTMSTFEQHFRINTIGPALVSQAIVPYMGKDSKLIQISSGLGSLEWNINPQMPLDAYAMSKCSLHSLTVRLAEKLREKRIIVVAINPGWVKTDMGGSEAPKKITEVINNITKTVGKLTIKHTGKFLSDQGELIPW